MWLSRFFLKYKKEILKCFLPFLSLKKITISIKEIRKQLAKQEHGLVTAVLCTGINFTMRVKTVPTNQNKG